LESGSRLGEASGAAWVGREGSLHGLAAYCRVEWIIRRVARLGSRGRSPHQGRRAFRGWGESPREPLV